MIQGSQPTTSPTATTASTFRRRSRVTTSATANNGANTSTLSVGRTNATRAAAAPVETRPHHHGSWTARKQAKNRYRAQPNVQVRHDLRPEDDREPDRGEEQGRCRGNSRPEQPEPGPEGGNQTEAGQQAEVESNCHEAGREDRNRERQDRHPPSPGLRPVQLRHPGVRLGQ